MSEGTTTKKTSTAAGGRKKSTAKAAPAPKPKLSYADIKDMPLKKQIAMASRMQHELAGRYKAEEKVTVAVSPLYKPYFGNSMIVSLNGIPIYIPCDNKRYQIPKSYAMEVMSRIRRVDMQINRESRLADVKNNFDGQVAGGRDLIKAL